MKLYSYCLRIDDGAAPNPFWGTCTLVICKPAIRRTAEEGDWIVGLGSANSPVGDIQDSVVYAMKVTTKMSMAQYDQHCRVRLPQKIPKWTSPDYRERVGDCIYDFSVKPEPAVRKSVHSVESRKRDLSGENALLSALFYYFGDKPTLLPPELRAIIHSTQGHKVKANDPFAARFVDWISGLKLKRNCLYGEPQGKNDLLLDPEKIVCDRRDLDDDDDEIC